MMICGFCSNGANTDNNGVSSNRRICPSVVA